MSGREGIGDEVTGSLEDATVLEHGPAGVAKRRYGRRTEELSRRTRFLLGTLTLCVFAGAWQLCTDLHIVSAAFASSPSAIAVAEYHYFVSGTGVTDVETTAAEVGIGLGLSIAIGVPLGLLVGYYSFVAALVDPFLSLMYATPFIALAPLFVVWFGLGIESKVTFVMVAIMPITIVVSAGVRTVEKSLLNVARIYSANPFQIFRTLILPGTVSSVIAAIRIGTAFALIGAVTAELIASSKGLGYTIGLTGTSFSGQTDLLFAAILVVAVAGIVLAALLQALERHLDRWRVSEP